MKNLHKVTFLLLVVGGLNWGLVGLFSYNLVASLLGSWPVVEQVVYVLVGLSAVYELLTHPKTCRACTEK
jgi:uncharacterized membrane protein YuzA (DUF378 family)